MKLQWVGRTNEGRFALSAEGEAYDATPPVAQLIMDKDPLIIHDDILCVVSVLLYGSYISGPVSLPRRASVEVAQAIERFVAPAWTSVSPVEPEPRANPVGEGDIVLSWGELPREVQLSEWGKPRVTRLHISPAGQYAGWLLSMDMMIVASNAFLHSAMGDQLAALPYVAMAALFAETFRANTIVLPANHGLDEATFARASDLLASCKLNLRVAAN